MASRGPAPPSAGMCLLGLTAAALAAAAPLAAAPLAAAPLAAAPLAAAPLAAASCVGADAAPGPQLMPPHPDVLARIAADGYDSATVLDLRRLAELRRREGIDQPEPITAAVTGTRPALVLLVDFSDMTHDAVSTPALYDDMLFSVGTYAAPGSMRDFYQESSYGLFDILPSLVDSAWRQVGHAHDYYADADGIPGTDDDYGFGDFPQNAQGLVVDAVTLADPFVNFADFAVGSEVQGLFVIHAGRGAETGSSHKDWIWSHKWGLYGHAVTVDGVTVNIYSMEPEYVWSAGDSTVGVFCHEYGHVLGLPDLYDTDGSCEGLGDWSLMAGGSWNGSGGTSPAYPDAWCKIELGWVTPLAPTANDIAAAIPYAEDNPFAYQLWTQGLIGAEYFLLENRQPVGFDAALDGDGLLLYHVDEDASQTDDWHPKVMVEQADGLWDLQNNTNDGDDGDPFPGASSNREAHSATTPSTLSYAAGYTQVAIKNISDSALTMTADIYVKLVLEIHVELSGNDLDDGLTWDTAKQTIQGGLDVAGEGDEVWVAGGLYLQRPINMPAEVALYGGFDGTETEREQRDWRANVTILDANRTGSVLIVASGATAATRIDGFTIRGAYPGPGVECGLGSPTIANNTITENLGDGVHCANGAAAVVSNLITDNGANGIVSSGDYAETLVRGNTISGNGSAGIHSYGPPTIANNIIAYNYDGIHRQHNVGDYPWLRNNCVYGNARSNYLYVVPGVGDISEDPQFVDYPAGDLHLLPTSPCIDAGEDSYVRPGDVDMDGEARIWGAHVDIGADEFVPQLWFEDDEPAISYTGAWSQLAHPAASAGHLTYSNGTGARADFTFEGTGLRWMLAAGPMAGKADVYLNGAHLGRIDLYRSRLQLIVLERTGLALGSHTVSIDVSGGKNPSSSGYYVDIDAFQVVP